MHSLTWNEDGSEVAHLIYDTPVIQALRSPLSAFQYHIWSPKTVLMMGEGSIWVWLTIQTNRKQSASNREDFKQ